MFKTKNDLTEAVRIKVIELLNARLAKAGCPVSKLMNAEITHPECDLDLDPVPNRRK